MSTKPDVFPRFPSPQNLPSPQYQTSGFGKLIRIDRLVDQCSSGKAGVQRKNDHRQNAGTDGTCTSLYLASVKRIGDVPSVPGFAPRYFSGWRYRFPFFSAKSAERMGHPMVRWSIRKVKGSGQECPLYTGGSRFARLDSRGRLSHVILGIVTRRWRRGLFASGGGRGRSGRRLRKVLPGRVHFFPAGSCALPVRRHWRM